MYKLSDSELNQWRNAPGTVNPAPAQKSLEGYLHDYKKEQRLHFFFSRRVSFALWELLMLIGFVLGAMALLISHIHE